MSLRTIEIPRAEWSRALSDFSSMHEGSLVSLDILSPGMGAQPEITDLPLVGVSFEAAGAGMLFVAAARSASDHITHTISAPTRVFIERAESGADLALEAESSDGTKAILRFKTPARSDSVQEGRR